MRIFVDIDGTLTRDGEQPWGEPQKDVMETVRSAIAAGHEVVIWSAQGAEYADVFCHQYHLHPTACLGKPDIYVDDHEGIRPGKRMEWVKPAELAGYLAANGWDR